MKTTLGAAILSSMIVGEAASVSGITSGKGESNEFRLLSSFHRGTPQLRSSTARHDAVLCGSTVAFLHNRQGKSGICRILSLPDPDCEIQRIVKGQGPEGPPKISLRQGMRKMQKVQSSAESYSSMEQTVVILYNKPQNVITSHSNDDPSKYNADEGRHRRTVYDDVMSMEGFVANEDQGDAFSFSKVTGIQSKLHAVGRLDVDTTGLLLLTNDGGLVHHVTHPNNSNAKKNGDIDKGENPERDSTTIYKTYEAVIMGYHEDDETYGIIAQLRQGVDLGPNHGGTTRPVDNVCVLDHPTPKSTRICLTISEGRNRQVRRMFHALGSGVMKLRRTAMGRRNQKGGANNEDSDEAEMSLTLRGVEKEGQWRLVSSDEVWNALGWRCRRLPEHPAPGKRRLNEAFSSKRKRRRRP